MLLIKYLIYFLSLHLIYASPQINLYLTDWINENGYNTDLEHNCLRIDLSNGTSSSRDIISYCLSELSQKWNIQRNDFDQIFTFTELHLRNITSKQLYDWSAPIDVIERYQLYLNLISIGHIQPTMGTQLFYNCSLPRFGPLCQYSLDIYVPDHLPLNEIINNYYYQPYESETLTCYTHLQCNRGSTRICLDWSEICDGKIDCNNGIDEENCESLIINKCENSEYRCDNGQCISKTFINDTLNGFECLDRSDEQRILSLPSDNEYDKPIFENEDIICSWRGGRTNNFMEKHFLTSSCRRQRHTIIEQEMLSTTSSQISSDCLMAFKCHSNIPTNDNPLCSDFCQGESCIKIIQDTCPEMFYYPFVPIAYNHIYFAYTKQYVINWRSGRPISPEYICYNDKLCSGFNTNSTLQFINGNTCRRPEDFPVLFNIRGRDWYSNYVLPLYSQLGHCNRNTYDSSVICNSSTMYQCKNSSKCIPISYVGDRIRDCDYNDDEEQTIIDQLCLIDQSNIFFKCQTTNKCIHRNQIEDGVCDCGINYFGICDDEDIKLNRIGQKITFSTICDNFPDLIPIGINGQIHTDETNCEFWPCSNTYTQCDGYWNCPDGSDELDCNSLPLIQCPSSFHICISPSTNQPICLPISKANDGIIDCLGGIDEPLLCSAAQTYKKEKKFYCKRDNSQLCISPMNLCNGNQDCEYGDDEQFCNHTSNLSNLIPNHPSNTIAEEFFYAYFYNTFKTNTIKSGLSKILRNEQRCQRGIPLRVWLDVNKDLSTTTCLCPPSYYGNRCQYQNQRVSLTMQINVPSRSYQTPFVIVISLIDDSTKRIIHSYHQFSYIHIRDQNTKFNIYLLYSTRPKDSTKQYAIHIDIYEMFTLFYRGSHLIPLKFPFLPVERIAVELSIPPVNTITQTCSDHQCMNGRCIRYFNDSKGTSFCQCDPGWTGRYCNIRYQCTCSLDSLCAGITANNQSICLCPMNKFGSQCLLSNNICQPETCLNGGLCIPSDEPSITRNPYVCMCPKGFSGKRCEVPDTKIILSFDKDMDLISRSFILVHFIYFFDNTLRYQNNSVQMFCDKTTPVVIQWPYPFHIAFVELPVRQYHLIMYQNNYHSSSVIAGTINPLDRCLSINEIFNETIVAMHLIQRIKYYHIPCQQQLNMSCFYDDIHICLCQNYDGKRLANCFEFNHYKDIDDLDFDTNIMERECDEAMTSNSPTSTLSSSSASSIPSVDNGITSVHPQGLIIYSIILIFCLYIHYA